MTLKEMLYNDDGSKKTVTFTHYFDSNLWYETQDHFAFPVPISDVGNATFKATDYAPLFMRYIRKHLETLEGAK
jgi:hypothetical protein